MSRKTKPRPKESYEFQVVIGMCLEELKEANEVPDPRYPEVIGTRRIEVSA